MDARRKERDAKKRRGRKKREMMVNMEMIFTRPWEGERQGDRKWWLMGVFIGWLVNDPRGLRVNLFRVIVVMKVGVVYDSLSELL